MTTSQKVQLPPTVAQQFEAIRAAGSVNMLHRKDVYELAELIDADELVEWMDDHWEDYPRIVFHGYEEA